MRTPTNGFEHLALTLNKTKYSCPLDTYTIRYLADGIALMSDLPQDARNLVKLAAKQIAFLIHIIAHLNHYVKKLVFVNTSGFL